MEGAGNLGEVADESPVEVHEPYEGLDILDLCWLQPVCDSLDFNRVHRDRKSTRLNSSHANISYAVFCLKPKNTRLNSSNAHSLLPIPTPSHYPARSFYNTQMLKPIPSPETSTSQSIPLSESPAEASRLL